jgi:diguanylate cyclase (GGDEF)-like protein
MKFPPIPDFLKHATNEKEKAYLNYIQQIKDYATKDLATGMLRKEFFEPQSQGVYIFIDGDGLKKLNDETEDHYCGDAAIMALSKAIINSLRMREGESIQVTREGGDEFVVFVGGVALPVGLKIAQRILNSIRSHKALDYYRGTNPQSKQYLKDHQLTASLGVGYTREDADKGVYKAKAKGRNRVEFHVSFQAPEQKIATNRSKQIKAAQHLISKNQFYAAKLILEKAMKR